MVEEKTTKQLHEEYYKEHPEKAPLLHRIKARRDETRKEREHYGKLYKEADAKAKGKAVIERAKREAREKYRPTRKQRTASALKGFENFGFGAAGISKQRRASPKKKKGKKKKGRRQTQPRDSFDFNFDFVDDIGDFEF